MNNNSLKYIDQSGLANKNGGDGSATGKNTSHPYKHCREHPFDSTKIICKDKKTGKKKVVSKPKDWPENTSNNSMSCNTGCQAGLVLVGGVCMAALCASNPLLCGIAVGGGFLGAQ